MRIRHPTKVYNSKKPRFPLPSGKFADEKKEMTTVHKKSRSRVVTIIAPMKKNTNSMSKGKQRYLKFKKSRFCSSANIPKNPLRHCPNAPHNTTSFLMNFHRDEILNKFELDRTWTSDDDDENSEDLKPVSAYGSFFVPAEDSYEVASQVDSLSVR